MIPLAMPFEVEVVDSLESPTVLLTASEVDPSEILSSEAFAVMNVDRLDPIVVPYQAEVADSLVFP